eukprot:g7765.t1
MAILNVTPDSFSDGGRFAALEAAVAHGLACVADGASILDIGGESTRPGASAVSAAEEQDRVLPVIETLSRRTQALISVDTYRADTARLALAAGAHIVNDVSGLQHDPDMAAAVGQAKAGVCIMHTGRNRDDRLPDVIEDQVMFLERSLKLARAAGIADDAIVLDPGFGFAKNREEDVDLMARFEELHQLGFPLLVGTSRKRFVGAIAGRELPDERDAATAATTVILRLAGAALFRVHDVAGNIDAAGDALISDDVAATVHYGLAYELVEKIVTGSRRNLIETLAHDVAVALCQWSALIRRAEVAIRKPSVPIAGILDYVEADFFNCCALVETELAPEALLDLCLSIERDMKRIRGERWGPRTLDIDILTFGTREQLTEALELPHPRMTERAFVMLPLADIAPRLEVAGRAVESWAGNLVSAGIRIAQADTAWWRAASGADRPTA